MASNVLKLTTSVGRVISGRPGVGQTTDYEGKPITLKDGSAGTQYSFGVAFPKTPGVTHWAQENSLLGFVDGVKDQPWLPAIWAFGHAEYKAIAQNDKFAWKIQDGDSTAVNKNGKRLCDREGAAGHWVVWFSTFLKVQLVNANGSQPLTDENAIRTGDFVQVVSEIVPNNSKESPGLHINPKVVAHSAYGTEIISEARIDTTAVGLGGAPLPPGASMTPPAGVGATPPPPAPPAAPSAPAPVTPPPAAPAPVAPPPAAPAPVAPMPEAVPTVAPPAPPAPPAAPAAPVGPVMLPAANGVSYEAYKASGWSDEQLRSAGYMA